MLLQVKLKVDQMKPFPALATTTNRIQSQTAEECTCGTPWAGNVITDSGSAAEAAEQNNLGLTNAIDSTRTKETSAKGLSKEKILSQRTVVEKSR